MSSLFKFKEFDVLQDGASLKIGTDAMILGSLINNQNASEALDIGTGTGVLSLMVAQSHLNLLIDAIEIDKTNARLAQINFEKSKFKKRLHLIHGDFLEFHPKRSYDLIFSNPPFFIDSLNSLSNRKNQAKHFSASELKLFVEKMVGLLTEEGKGFLIIPFTNLNQWLQEFNHLNVYVNHRTFIFGKIDQVNRVILEYAHYQFIRQDSKIIIRDLNGNYTKEYIELTKNFHGKKLNTSQ